MGEGRNGSCCVWPPVSRHVPIAVDLVLIKREGAYLDSIPPGVRLVVLNTRRTLNSILALAGYLRRERPAAMLTALVHVNVGALLATALSRVRTRVIVTEHSQITRNFAALTSRTVKLAYRLVPRIYPLATRVVAVSGGVADDLAGFSGMRRDNISVIHNGIVTPELYAKAAEIPAIIHGWLQVSRRSSWPPGGWCRSRTSRRLSAPSRNCGHAGTRAC